jgi:hypothetical protein
LFLFCVYIICSAIAPKHGCWEAVLAALEVLMPNLDITVAPNAGDYAGVIGPE